MLVVQKEHLRPAVYLTDRGHVQWTLLDQAVRPSAFALERILDMLMRTFGREGLEGTVAVQRMGTDIRPHFLVGLRKVPAHHRGAVACHLLHLREHAPASFLLYMHDDATATACLLRVNSASLACHDLDLAVRWTTVMKRF